MQLFRLNPRTISIHPNIILYTIGISSLAYVLFLIRSIILQVFIAFLIMTALRPFTLFLQNKLKFPRVLAIIVVYLVVLSLLILAVLLVVPPLVTESQNLLRTFGVWSYLPVQQIQSLSFSLQDLNSLASSFGQSIPVLLGIVAGTFSGLFALFTILVISVYLLIDRNKLHSRIEWFTKKSEHIHTAQRFVDEVEDQLGGWVRAQLILMLSIGVITYIGLLVLGIPYALPLAILAGLLELLPNIGPTLSAIPGVVLGFLTGGWVLGIAVLVFYIVVQQLENNLLVPNVMSANVNVSPLATILTILVGLQLAGVVGALLAVPIYIVGRTMYGFWRGNLQ